MNRQGERTTIDRIKNQIRFFNRRFFNPFALSFAGRPRSFWSVLYHTGRRSGQEYITPVVAAHRAGGFVIPLPYGREVDWLKNVLAAGGAELIYQGNVYRVAQPEVIALEQGLDAFPDAVQRMLRGSGTKGFVHFNQCTLAPDNQACYAAFTADYPFERGAWILVAMLAFMFGISRQFRRRRRHR